MNTLSELRAKLALWGAFRNDVEMPLSVTPEEGLPLISCNYEEKTQHIISYLPHSLKDIITAYDVQQHWLHKGKLKEVNDERIDNSAFNHALSSTPQHKRVWLAKWNSVFCGMGKHLDRWRDQTRSMCPH